MHLEILVEEQSAEAALNLLIPRIVGDDVTFRVHPHQGKHDLLGKLPDKLRGYARWIAPDVRLVVLIDLDNQDCRALKRRLEALAADAGLGRSHGPGGTCEIRVLNRIAITELEAWLLGDIPAVRAAFPGAASSRGSTRPFAQPDRIRDAWERFEQVLQRAGYYKAGLAKTDAARRVAAHMDPDRNRSKSFQVFRDGLRTIAGCPGPGPAST